MALNDHIININFYIIANLFLKDLVHQPLASCSYIFQAKWYYPITKQSFISNKRGFLQILGCHLDLIVSSS